MSNTLLRTKRTLHALALYTRVMLCVQCVLLRGSRQRAITLASTYNEMHAAKCLAAKRLGQPVFNGPMLRSSALSANTMAVAYRRIAQRDCSTERRGPLVLLQVSENGEGTISETRPKLRIPAGFVKYSMVVNFQYSMVLYIFYSSPYR